MTLITRILLFCALLASATAQGAEKGPLVFAAASLTDALTDVGRAFATSGQPEPAFSFAASSTIARQIENGAPATLFISADQQWMDYLAMRNLIVPASRVALLGNALVLIAPADHPMHLAIAHGFPLIQALHGGKLAMADPDSVPAGIYGKAALENLGLWAAVGPTVIRGDNVRTALEFVERDEAAAGIVYLSDAAITPKVMIAGTFPAESHPPIVYPAALVTSNANLEAQAFLAFMQTPAAMAIFTHYGFTRAP